MKRLESLDILRGLAIIGTLGTNIWLFSSFGDTSVLFGNDEEFWKTANGILQALVLFLVNGKFLGMLTLLFGAGLELKRKRALKRGERWPGLYLWSCFLLLIEGYVHYLLVMEYDILMSYAVTAIIVSFVATKSDRAAKTVMISAGGLHFLMVVSVFLLTLLSPALSDEVNLNLYRDGSWIDQIMYRFDSFWIYRSESIFIIPLNVFLFLLGKKLLHLGVFAFDDSGRRWRKKLLKIGIGALPLNFLLIVQGELFMFPVRYLFAPLLSLGYISLVIMLYERKKNRFFFTRLSEIGRTALSCYILQNILSSYIFYGWGLGLGGRDNAFLTVSVLLIISCLLALFSNVWLSFFPRGPFESLWRWLSYLPTKKTN